MKVSAKTELNIRGLRWKDAVMSKSDISTAFKSKDFDLGNTKSLDSTLVCRVCIDRGHDSSKCRQITSLPIFIRTSNKNLLDWSPRNHNTYYLKTANIANIDERRASSSYNREQPGETFSTEVAHDTTTEVFHTHKRCKVKTELCTLDLRLLLRTPSL